MNRIWLLCLTLVFWAQAGFAQSEGSWRRISLNNRFDRYVSGTANTLFAGKTRTGIRIVPDGSTSDGSLKASFAVSYPGGQNEIHGAIRWSPPPATARPGDVWRPEVSVDKPEMPEFSAQMSVLWAYTDPKDSNRMGGADAIPQMTFPGLQSGYGSELRHLVIQATPSVGSNRLVCSVSDQYRYLYEWVEGPAAPAPVSATPSTAPPPDKPAGHLRLIFNTNQGGPVSGASIAVRELSSGQLKRLTTNSQGEAKAMFRGEEAGEPVAVEVEEVVLNAQTRYGLALGSPQPSFLSAPLSKKLKVHIDIGPASNYFTTQELRLELFRLSVITLAMQADQSWVPASTIVRLADGANRRMEVPRDYVAGQSPRILYVPVQKWLNSTRLSVLAYDPTRRLKALGSLAIPAKAESRNITLLLCDVATRIAHLRQDMYEFFRSLLGEQEARRISQLPIDLVRVGNPRFDGGRMQIPEGLDLTQDESAETLMHEWGHGLTSLLHPDPDIEGQVGGAHEPWTVAATPELAWDEARAHLYGALLTRALELPYNPRGFSPEAAQTHTGEAQAGNRIEGVAAAALLDYYRASGYRSSKEVMRDFLAVQAHCQSTQGHPPRTTQEFFQSQQQWLQARQTQGSLTGPQAQRALQEINRVRGQYAIP